MVVTYLKYSRYVYLKYQKGFLASLAYFSIKKEQCNFSNHITLLFIQAGNRT